MDHVQQDSLSLLVGGRYEVAGLLAAGGMGDVFEARDTVLERRVALKRLRPSGDPSFLDRFRREATNAARLAHPNIVQVYDFGRESSGGAFIAMELVEGRTLRDVLAERGRIAPREAARIGAEICAALDHAHRGGIVHRDIKPENVLLASGGEVKVADFGLSRPIAESGATQAGSVFGTPHYLAPEQVDGRPADARTDLYALGIVLYEMLAGRPPFEGESPAAIAYRRVGEDVEPPSAVNPAVPEMLDDVVLTATARRPEERYASAASMGAALRAIAAGPSPLEASGTDPFAIETQPTIAIERRRKRDRPRRRRTGGDRRRLRWLVVALAVAAAAAAAPFALTAFSRVEVPDVSGRERAAAVAALEDAGLRPVVDFLNHDAIPAGEVIATEPRGGTRARSGSRVRVVVSLGPETANVPDVRGKPAGDAETALAELGFEVELAQAYSGSVARGLVVSQEPASGVVVRKGAPVKIVVSRGVEMVAVPRLAGRTEDEARAALGRAGFDVGVKRVFDDAEAGTVIRQSRKAGSRLAKGSRLTITVSKGPPPVAIPNLRCMSLEQARDALGAKGLRARFEGSGGRVVDQDPAPGRKIPRGGTVTAFLGSGVYC